MTVTGNEQRVYGQLLSDNLCYIDPNKVAIVFGESSPDNASSVLYGSSLKIRYCGYSKSGDISFLYYNSSNQLIDIFELHKCKKEKPYIFIETYSKEYTSNPPSYQNRSLWFNKSTNSTTNWELLNSGSGALSYSSSTFKFTEKLKKDKLHMFCCEQCVDCKCKECKICDRFRVHCYDTRTSLDYYATLSESLDYGYSNVGDRSCTYFFQTKTLNHVWYNSAYWIEISKPATMTVTIEYFTPNNEWVSISEIEVTVPLTNQSYNRPDLIIEYTLKCDKVNLIYYFGDRIFPASVVNYNNIALLNITTFNGSQYHNLEIKEIIESDTGIFPNTATTCEYPVIPFRCSRADPKLNYPTSAGGLTPPIWTIHLEPTSIPLMEHGTIGNHSSRSNRLTLLNTFDQEVIGSIGKGHGTMSISWNGLESPFDGSRSEVNLYVYGGAGYDFKLDNMTVHGGTHCIHTEKEYRVKEGITGVLEVPNNVFLDDSSGWHLSTEASWTYNLNLSRDNSGPRQNCKYLTVPSGGHFKHKIYYTIRSNMFDKILGGSFSSVQDCLQHYAPYSPPGLPVYFLIGTYSSVKGTYYFTGFTPNVLYIEVTAKWAIHDLQEIIYGHRIGLSGESFEYYGGVTQTSVSYLNPPIFVKMSDKWKDHSLHNSFACCMMSDNCPEPNYIAFILKDTNETTFDIEPLVVDI